MFGGTHQMGKQSMLNLKRMKLKGTSFIILLYFFIFVVFFWRLKVFPYAEHLVIGDRHLLKLKSCDSLIRRRDWIKKKSLLYLPDKVPQNDSSTLTNTYAEPFGTDDDWSTEEDEEFDSKAEISSYRITKIKPRKKHCSPKWIKFFPGSIVAVEVKKLLQKSFFFVFF